MNIYEAQVLLDKYEKSIEACLQYSNYSNNSTAGNPYTSNVQYLKNSLRNQILNELTRGSPQYISNCSGSSY